MSVRNAGHPRRGSSLAEPSAEGDEFRHLTAALFFVFACAVRAKIARDDAKDGKELGKKEHSLALSISACSAP
jgi:hypothetical protein